MKLSLGPLSLSFALVVAGCGAVDAGTNIPGPAPEQAPPAAVATKPFEVEWTSCTIPMGRDRSIEAECATVDAPARRGSEDKTTTPVAVYRLKSKKQPASAQLWMLNGGPGGAGFSLAPYGQMVTMFEQGVDAYLVDHRGTGESEFLECPSALQTSRSMDEYAVECSKEIRKAYGNRVDGFSTTESAADVRDLIASTATPEQKVFVYGGSYGSYWAHRFLQLPDVRVDAVVTDGNCISDTCSFDTPQTFAVDEVMKEIAEICKSTASCSTKVGADPWAFAKATAEKLNAGHCSQAALTQYGLADIVHTIGVYWPAGLMPLLYRLDRCSAVDITVLDGLEQHLRDMNGGRIVKVLPDLAPAPPKPTFATSYSRTLQMHVIASEMVSNPAPTASALRAKAATLVFAPDQTSFDLSYMNEWTGYPRDEHVGKWIEKDVPWLMMQGTFDFQTVYSLSQRALEHVKDPSLQFVRIDGGGHGVVFDSKCSVGILEKFLANPRAKVESGCVSEVATTALALEPMYVQYFFGTQDAWD